MLAGINHVIKFASRDSSKSEIVKIFVRKAPTLGLLVSNGNVSLIEQGLRVQD